MPMTDSESNPNSMAARATLPVVVNADVARAVYEDAVRRWAEGCRERIPLFVDSTFRLRSSLRLHRRAFGWDLVRAPVNVAMAAPNLALHLAATAARARGREPLARWLEDRQVMLGSDVAREIEWRLFDDLLRLPYSQGDRQRTDDALAELMLADPRLELPMRAVLAEIGRRADEPAMRVWLTDAMRAYTGSRVAAADLAQALIASGVGLSAFGQMTPGMLSLGPLLAATVAQHTVITSFPLGAGLGGLWYGMFPVTATKTLAIGMTGGLILVPTVLGAFVNILVDPIQARFGLHRRRLLRLVDALEREFLGHGDGRFVLRDQYVARVLDLFDVLGAAWRVLR